MLLKVKCSGCGKRLIDFEQGEPGQVKIHSHGVAINTRKFPQKIGIAICPKCGGETEFDAQYLPIPPGKFQ